MTLYGFEVCILCVCIISICNFSLEYETRLNISSPSDIFDRRRIHGRFHTCGNSPKPLVSILFFFFFTFDVISRVAGLHMRRGLYSIFLSCCI